MGQRDPSLSTSRSGPAAASASASRPPVRRALPELRQVNSAPPARGPLDTSSRSPLLRSFLLHLASERGLAPNTVFAYRRDLEGLGPSAAKG